MNRLNDAGKFDVDLVLSGPNGFSVTQTEAVSGLKRGRQATVTFEDVELPSTGDYQYEIQVDPDDDVPESSNTNNNRKGRVRVSQTCS